MVFGYFQETRAGDLITSSTGAAKKAYETLAKVRGVTENDVKELLGLSSHSPESVFFCSIEAPSQV